MPDPETNQTTEESEAASKQGSGDLLERYKIAIGLYNFEDQLNYTKLQRMLVINGALWAVVAFVLGDLYEPGKAGPSALDLLALGDPVVSIVSVFGIVVSAAFAIALVYGTKYVNARKDAAIAIERKLIRGDGLGILSGGDKETGWRKESPTVWMLRVVPSVFLIAWLVLFLATL